MKLIISFSTPSLFEQLAMKCRAVTELPDSLPWAPMMFAQSLGRNVIFYLRTSISVTSCHIKQDILTTQQDRPLRISHGNESMRIGAQFAWMLVCLSLARQATDRWWRPGCWAQGEVSVYGRSQWLSRSDSAHWSDQSPLCYHPSWSWSLCAGCAVC